MPVSTHGSIFRVTEVLFLSLLIIVTIIGNSLIYSVVYRTNRLHNPSGFLLVNLAIINCLVGAMVLPFSYPGMLLSYWPMSEALCTFNGFTNHLLGVASVWTLLCISIDRYIAIVHALKYNMWMTKMRSFLMIAVVWLFALCVSVLPLVGWGNIDFLPGLWMCTTDYTYSLGYTYFNMSTVFFLPLCSIIFMYYYIFKVARRQTRQIRAEVVASDRINATANRQANVSEAGDKRPVIEGGYCLRKHSSIRQELKAAFTLAMVLGCLFVSWTPHIAVSIYSCHLGFVKSIITHEVTWKLYYLNGCVSPLIYGYYNRHIKVEIKKLWRTFKSKFTCKCLQRKTKVQPISVISK